MASTLARARWMTPGGVQAQASTSTSPGSGAATQMPTTSQPLTWWAVLFTCLTNLTGKMSTDLPLLMPLCGSLSQATMQKYHLP